MLVSFNCSTGLFGVGTGFAVNYSPMLAFHSLRRFGGDAGGVTIERKIMKLSSYQLACGYVEKCGGLSLSREHGVYHVRGFVGASHVSEAFKTLLLAREFVKSLLS